MHPMSHQHWRIAEFFAQFMADAKLVAATKALVPVYECKITKERLDLAHRQQLESRKSRLLLGLAVFE